jgi:hypothetical protein
MNTGLPEPIKIYLAADRAQDTEMLALCFADDARVRDEEQDYHGLQAIRAWQQEAQAKYKYTVEPLEFAVEDNSVTLHARLTGNFPGSPVELDYLFTLDGNRITELEIK